MSNWCSKRLGILVWMMVAWGVAGAVLAQDENAGEAPPPERQRVMISSGLGSAVIAAQRPDDAVWLDLEGDDTALGLFEPEQRLPVEGALLMLADEGHSAASELLAGLGKRLSSRGWAVMTLGLEAPPYELQQAWNEANADPAEASAVQDAGEDAESVMIDVMDEGEREDLESDYWKRVQAMLAAASANLRERGYDRVVLVSVGAAAIHLARYAREGNAGEQVWVTPRFYPRDEPGLIELLAGADALALLHLYSAHEDAARTTARAWAVQLKKAGMSDYRAQPVAVPSPAGARDADALAGRIRSWLTSE